MEKEKDLMIDGALKIIKAPTDTSIIQVMYKDRAIVSITKTFNSASKKKHTKYHYYTNCTFVLNGKVRVDSVGHLSLSKALKYARDIFIARNNNMINNNYRLEEESK